MALGKALLVRSCGHKRASEVSSIRDGSFARAQARKVTELHHPSALEVVEEVQNLPRTAQSLPEPS